MSTEEKKKKDLEVNKLKEGRNHRKDKLSLHEGMYYTTSGGENTKTKQTRNQREREKKEKKEKQGYGRKDKKKKKKLY